MQLSIFDVLGPEMIGPSSSHTAGAVKLARIAATIAAMPFKKVSFGLSGSFAKTGKGHGTHNALIAGILGMKENDERIVNANQIAREKEIEIEFYEEDIEWIHENAVHIKFYHVNGEVTHIYGASIGGGRIKISQINSFKTNVLADAPTLIFFHKDIPGMISEITRVLAENNINIATMQVAREEKGKLANTTVELDESISPTLTHCFSDLEKIDKVIFIDV